ncbi:hypothetical protein Slin15195_G091370 [Septoria linicola]|uniref:Uncharacterized protein n=1 Tax=Septoria linicola TaxID=215465 RepID=A0A9Q9ENU2_9PEZI|nr:hypothetical protein Slin14017_G054520 [Septoria linicola]USW55818.1 hypothetical protein Slin15195_G091370 [Septoria linicola]
MRYVALPALFSASIGSGVVQAQRFANSATADFAHPGVGAKCDAALESIIACPEMLGGFARLSEVLTPEQLAETCTPECAESLQTAKSEIEAKCKAASDVIVEDDIAYPATYWVDKYIYEHSKSCLKDAETGQFCDTLFELWTGNAPLDR